MVEDGGKEESVEDRFEVDLEATTEEIMRDLEEESGANSYGILNNPDLKSILKGSEGKAVLRGPENPKIEHEYEDAWGYLNECVDTEAMDAVGVINPMNVGELPPTFVIADTDDEKSEEISFDDYGSLEVDYSMTVSIHYSPSDDSSIIYADHSSPDEDLVEFR